MSTGIVINAVPTVALAKSEYIAMIRGGIAGDISSLEFGL